MLAEAATVFLALIGTTLSCINTGARVTYAMGKDKELPDSMGMLHARNSTPHRAIWTLAIISAVVGCITVVMYFGDGAAPADAAIQALPHGFWSSFGYLTHDKMAALPNSFLTPVFGLVANLACMVFYLVGPFMGYGTKMEPLLALGIALVWAIYGAIYFLGASKATKRTTLVENRVSAA